MKRPVVRSASRYRGFLGAIKPAKLVHPGSWSTFRTGHPGASLQFRRDKRLARSCGQRVQFDVRFLVRLCRSCGLKCPAPAYQPPVPIAIGRLQRAGRSCLRFPFVAADIRQPWLERAARLAGSAGSAIPDFASLNPGYGLVSWGTRAHGELAKRNQPHPRRGRYARGLRQRADPFG
jgi:hypothetical protein